MNQLAGLKRELHQGIDWVLNVIEKFPKNELNQSNLRPMTQGYKIQEQIDKQSVFSYNKLQEKFTLSEVTLYQNLLIKDGDQFLILSSCTQQPKIIKYKQIQTFGIILTSIIGQTYLFFDSIQKQLEVRTYFIYKTKWFKHLKKYCKQNGFLKKFTIKDKIKGTHQFSCFKNKNGSLPLSSQHSLGKFYLVEIYRDSDLQKDFENYEVLMNEIHILMCIKDSNLLPFKALYQDKNILFLLYNIWQGENLFRMIHTGYKFNEQQKCEIISQLIEFMKKIHGLGLSHCRLLPTSIFLLKQNNSFDSIKIAVTKFGFKEQNYFYWKWLKEHLPFYWLPPEIQVENESNSATSIDIYQIGCLLFFLEFYEPSLQYKNADEYLKNFKICYETIDKLQIRHQNEGIGLVFLKNSKLILQNKNRSIIELLLMLLNPDLNLRCSLQIASKHQWFINQKAKKGREEQKYLKVDYTLRTILELREFSEKEIRSCYVVKIDEEDDDDIIDLLCEENNTLANQIELLNTNSIYSNMAVKKHD